jgi:hypothetical protein
VAVPGYRSRQGLRLPACGNEFCCVVSSPPDLPHAADSASMNTKNQTVTADSSHSRESFSVEGMRVVLDGQRGWRCTCSPSEEDPRCTHVAQAQMFRSMRGPQREDETIELQFSAAQMRNFAGSTYGKEVPKQHAKVVSSRKRARRYTSLTVVATAASMSAIASGITYFAVTRAQGSGAVEGPSLSASLVSPPPSLPAAAGQVPVKFVNPFDPTEVFEFPPGTSQATARDAVAELLLNRARHRLESGGTMHVHGGETARPTRLAGSG